MVEEVLTVVGLIIGAISIVGGLIAAGTLLVGLIAGVYQLGAWVIDGLRD